MKNKLNPSDFQKKPMDSVLQNSESETIARNIMVILSRTSNKFRLLNWDEYSTERKKDGNFTQSEKEYFDKVVGYCVSEDTAKLFCSQWAD